MPLSPAGRAFVGLLCVLPLFHACRSDDGPAARRAAPGGRSPGAIPQAPELRLHHAEALGALVAGRKGRGEAAVAALKREILALEAQARLACLGPGMEARAVGPENRAACDLRAELVAINDRLAHRLAPGDPLAEQVDLLGWLSARLGRSFEGPFVPHPFPLSAARAVPEMELPASSREAPAAPLPRCRLGPARVIVPRGVAWAHTDQVGGVPTLLGLERCVPSLPPCPSDSLWLQALRDDGQPQGPPRLTPVVPGHFDEGAPVVLLGVSLASPVVLYLRDGDPHVRRITSQASQDPGTRPLLVRGEALGRRRQALTPVPAWLSAASGRSLELRIFSEWQHEPVTRVPLSEGGVRAAQETFGDPALLGVPEGFLVASTTSEDLRVHRLGRLGERLGPTLRVRLPGPGPFDPLCVLAAAGLRGRYLLALGRRGGRTLGVLVAVDPWGRPQRLPVSLMLPLAVPPGCPLDLVATRGRLLVVGHALPEGERGLPVLVAVELGPDGRRAGPLWRLGASARNARAIATGEGALVVWQREGGGGEALGQEGRAVMARSLRCP